MARPNVAVNGMSVEAAWEKTIIAREEIPRRKAKRPEEPPKSRAVTHPVATQSSAAKKAEGSRAETSDGPITLMVMAASQ
mgnify:CR=1 FL=1